MEIVKAINIMEKIVKLNAKVLVNIVNFVLEMAHVKNVKEKFTLEIIVQTNVINALNLDAIYMEYVLMVIQTVKIIKLMEKNVIKIVPK